jgi:hypothetical protein
MNLKKNYNSLPAPIQYTLIGGSIFLAYLLYKKFTSTETTTEQAQNDLKKELEKEKIRLANQKLTFPIPQYKLFANSLYENMRYSIGDNYGAVVSTMQKMMNDKDVVQLINDYGNRQTYVFGIPAGQPKDLFSTIKSELGDAWGGITGYQVDKINNNWQTKKITYRI